MSNGVFFGFTGTSAPTTANYAIYGDSGDTFVNVAPGGNVALKVNNTSYVTVVLASTTVANSLINSGITSDTGLTDASVCVGISTGGGGVVGQFYKGTGTLGTCLGTSGAQFKRLLPGPMSIGLREIAALTLHDYFYLPGHGDGGARRQFGPTAQDVEAVPGLELLVGHDQSTGEAINYDVGALMMGAFRSIQEIVESCNAANDDFCVELKRRSIR